MSRWLCHCVIPGRPHAQYCLFIHLISLFNWFCCSPDNESSQIPQRSLTINSEVADAALWDGVWVSSWQGLHPSCVTCPQYVWHVLSNTNPSPLYIHLQYKFTLVPFNFITFCFGIVTCLLGQLFYTFVPFDWPAYLVSSTTKALRSRYISRCFCSPAICSMRAGPLSIDLPSVMWLCWVQHWVILSMAGNRMDR